jgi:hypothetical protein
MARHGSTSSQSERQIPPSPRLNTRPTVAGTYPYQYQNQPTFTTGYNQGMAGRGNFRSPPGAPQFQAGLQQQFQRGQPPRSPHQGNIPMQPMYGLPSHMVQPMPAPGSYVFSLPFFSKPKSNLGQYAVSSNY